MPSQQFPFAHLDEQQLNVLRETERKLAETMGEDVILIAYERENSGHNNIPTG
ncbi:hypothetical protein [Bacillus sp. Marseille-P3661]|uniref:hypothetical protein n=1 Tax=Bacillus sp. Marseille-P3661 TaxID=1936234 RepID=UPI0015E1A4EF|nr:hypothetical protein [Bacillus sp. Marseille-P3661]